MMIFMSVTSDGTLKALILTAFASILTAEKPTAFAKHYPEVPFQVVTRDNYWEFLAMDNQ